MNRFSRGLTGTLSVALALGACKPRATAATIDASTDGSVQASASASVVQPTAGSKGPSEPPPPEADKADEVPKALDDLKADKAYGSLWEPAKKADLVLFLTAVSYALGTTRKDGGQTVLVALVDPLKAKKLWPAFQTVGFIHRATGKYPADFEANVRTFLQSAKESPHLGLWSEWRKGQPQYDVTVLASHLYPEDGAFLREVVASRRPKGGGPFEWENNGDPLRPWLSREISALRVLARLSTLTPEEKARLQELEASPLHGDPGEQVDLSDLIGDYKNNEVRADGKYKGHVVRTAGTASDIKKNAFDSIYIVLTESSRPTARNVHCDVPKNLESKAMQLDRGDSVTVRGRVKGLVLTSVFLEDCEISD